MLGQAGARPRGVRVALIFHQQAEALLAPDDLEHRLVAGIPCQHLVKIRVDLEHVAPRQSRLLSILKPCGTSRGIGYRLGYDPADNGQPQEGLTTR